MDPIVSIKNVNFTYNKGKNNEYHALININLEIFPEEYVIFFGPSGCGKSTLLNLVAGLEKPDEGVVEVFGKDLLSMDNRGFAEYHRKKVGMVYQQYNLITSLSVLDNVALPQMFVDVRKGRRNRWGKKLLERFGILQQADKIPTELSGGQQQRIGIARAIVNNPQIVLADEPVGNLDSVSAKNVLEIFSELNEKEKKTVIVVTHNPENLVYGDRIIYMKDGLITREVINTEKNRPKKKKDDGKDDEGWHKVKTAAVEIKDLMRAYQGLSPEQINVLIMPYKAKVFAHHFITTRNMEEAKIFEEVIQRRLLGTISQDEFMDVLNRPAIDGGVGFDSRTAEKILRRVNRVIRMAYFIYQEERQGDHEKISIDEKAKRVTDYILKTCYSDYYHHLDETQLERITSAVKERLEGEIQKPKFYELLDEPFKEGGVGLNSKTAKAFTEEMELVLILGFGIVQKRSSSDRDEKNESKTGEGDTAGEKLASHLLGEINEDENEDKKEKESNNKKEREDSVNDASDDTKKDSKKEDKKEEKSEEKSEEKKEEDFEDSVLNPDFASKKPRSMSDAMLEFQEREEKIKNQDNK